MCKFTFTDLQIHVIGLLVIGVNKGRLLSSLNDTLLALVTSWYNKAGSFN